MTARTMPAARWRRRATEDEMERGVRDLVAVRGGKLWHVRDARRSPELESLPDLIFVAPGVAGMVELKSQRRATTDGQAAVAALLGSVTAFVGGIVRPEPRDDTEMSYDDLIAILRGDA